MTSSSHYEGRPLPRPHEELVDQGLTFDLTTVLGRRGMLRALGLGGLAVGLAACGTATTGSGGATTTASPSGLTEIPDETAGPYPGDGSNGANVLTESGIVRSDIRSSFGSGSAVAAGIPMTLELTLTNLSTRTPYQGVAVYVWHCDRDGAYSLYSQGLENENYLRGVQIADAAGTVRFTSVFPACYAGRWPHIHFEVYPDQSGITSADNAIATSQVALPQQTCTEAYATAGYERSVTNLAEVSLTDDNVFGDDGGATQLATVTGSTAGYTVRLAVGVDPTTTPTGGQTPGDGAPAGAPPAGGRPPSRPN